jgi:hypothetical protein
MAGSEMRANRLMWFAAGAATMAIYLMGPQVILHKGHNLVQSASEWVQSR